MIVNFSYRNKPSFPFFCCHGWKREEGEFHFGSGFWFRIFWGYGLQFTNGPMLFSERNGLEKRLPLGFGWRAKVLKRQ